LDAGRVKPPSNAVIEHRVHLYPSNIMFSTPLQQQPPRKGAARTVRGVLFRNIPVKKTTTAAANTDVVANYEIFLVVSP
jgi:hypothetical protein